MGRHLVFACFMKKNGRGLDPTYVTSSRYFLVVTNAAFKTVGISGSFGTYARRKVL